MQTHQSSISGFHCQTDGKLQQLLKSIFAKLTKFANIFKDIYTAFQMFGIWIYCIDVYECCFLTTILAVSGFCLNKVQCKHNRWKKQGFQNNRFFEIHQPQASVCHHFFSFPNIHNIYQICQHGRTDLWTNRSPQKAKLIQHQQSCLTEPYQCRLICSVAPSFV